MVYELWVGYNQGVSRHPISGTTTRLSSLKNKEKQMVLDVSVILWENSSSAVKG